MDYQELLRKYITERQESEQKLVGGEVIELTLFASWLNKNAAQHSVHPTLLPARHKLVTCPQCKLMFGVDLPVSQSG